MSGNGIYDRFFKEQSKTALEGIGHLFSLWNRRKTQCDGLQFGGLS